MTENLQGVVAVVTGASSGIGQAIAKNLAAAGSKVVLVARRKQRLSDLASEIKKNQWICIAD